MKKIILPSIVFVLIFFSLDSSARLKGIYGKITKHKSKTVVLQFKKEASAKVGEVYKTNLKGVTFKVDKVNSGKTKVFGSINKKLKRMPKRLFLVGVGYVTRTKFTRKKKKKFKLNLNYSLFYAFSFGNFTEKVGGASLESSQNSPITLGVSAFQKISKDFSFSGSIYVSKLLSGVSNTPEFSREADNVTIPLEYGLTSYIEYRELYMDIKPYAGIDIESFSTFNLDELKDDPNRKLDVRTHRFFYTTIGALTLTKIFKRPTLIKASLSATILSGSSRQSLVSDEDFTGMKFMFFFATKIKNRWGASFLYKQHVLDGPTELTVSRSAVGISYRF